MKVLLAATNLDPSYGGPAYSVSRLAVALAECDIDVGLWSPNASALSTPLLPGDSPVRRLAGNASQALAQFGRPDVLHDNGLWLWHNHQMSAIASARRIPRVVSTRGMLEPWAINHKRLKKRIAWWMYQRSDLKRAAFIHATAETEAASLSDLDLGVRVRVIPNGVDLPKRVAGRAAQPANAAGVRTALFVGRLYPVKGLPMLVEAWAIARPKGWRLVLAGPDEAGHRLAVERVVALHGLGDVVSFTGAVEGDVKDAAFASAHLFVLPTHSESFGMAVAEAMASGLAVLTTTRAPWPVLVERGCGWQVEPTVDGLAAGLRTATSLGPESLSAMGAIGREIVTERLNWNSVAESIVRLYEDAIAGSDRPPNSSLRT